MDKKEYTTISIRLKTAELEKLEAIAQAESRFTSGQARYWLRRCIQDYEAGNSRYDKKHPER